MNINFKKVENFDLLLTTLENTDQTGQSAILEGISKHDSQLAALLSRKVLNVEKILAMDIRFCSDIQHHIPSNLLALVLFNRNPVYIGKFLSFLTPPDRKKLEIDLKSIVPSKEEILAAEIQLVHIVCDLERRRIIYLDLSQSSTSSHKSSAG